MEERYPFEGLMVTDQVVISQMTADVQQSRSKFLR
jgi:hypothetical protein